MRKKVIRVVRKLKLVEAILHLLMRLFSYMPIQKNRIIFESFLGKQFSDNPKAIYEMLRLNHPELELIFSKDKQVTFEKNVTVINRMTIRWIYLLATSKMWVSNSRLPSWLYKRPETVYLQTWHGTPLKKLALDMEHVQMANTSTEKYKKEFKKESAKWDILISPNAYSSKIFKRAFHFKGEILEIGYPRNDVFYQKKNHKNIVGRIHDYYGIEPGKKIILYAPTWRDDQFVLQGNYSFSLPFSCEQFEKRFGDEYVMLVRMHYLVGEQLNFEGFPSIKNVSSYPDISELYLAADMMVTDYSSVMFDYAHLKRPMLFYTYDLEHYRDRLRGFYFDFEEDVPGPLIMNEHHLFDEIQRLPDWHHRFEDKLLVFTEKYCTWDDGNVSKHVSERILKSMDEKRK
ncbi:CDP-glycerol glycerophosphotransferase family protein [Exiguobacterium undae]